MIRLTGLTDWRNAVQLSRELEVAPENGSFQFGVSHCNKLEQLRRMGLANVKSVPFTEDFNEVYQHCFPFHAARELPPEIWLGRKVNHTKGRDIKLPNSRWWRTRDFWTKYIPSVAEWRIHVFGGLSIARGEKIYVGADDMPATEIMIRARANDYRMDHHHEPPRGMRKLAKAAVAAVQEPYGAVDILVGADNQMYVLEVNVAPAMDDYTRAAYVKAIRAKFA